MEGNGNNDKLIYMTKTEVEELINEKLGSIRVYVSEADISSAQENMKAIVEQAEF